MSRRGASLRRAVLRVARPAATVSALALAIWLVRRELGQLRLADVAGAILATPPPALAACAAFTAASYACLVVSEWFAFGYTGRPQPLRRLAPLSFAAHAFASNLGFGLVSGAALRLRLYRPFGLDTKAVGALSVLVSTAIFLSGAVTLGLTLIVIALASARGLAGVAALGPGLLLLCPAVLWFAPLKRFGLGQDGRLGLRGRVLALSASAGDWVFSGAALFVLSNQGLAGLPVFLAVFISGSLAGSLVGLPAALGVLDASVLGSAVLSGKTHETAAALVLYRLVYFLAPLFVASTGALAGWLRRLGARRRPPVAMR